MGFSGRVPSTPGRRCSSSPSPSCCGSQTGRRERLPGQLRLVVKSVRRRTHPGMPGRSAGRHPRLRSVRQAAGDLVLVHRAAPTVCRPRTSSTASQGGLPATSTFSRSTCATTATTRAQHRGAARLDDPGRLRRRRRRLQPLPGRRLSRPSPSPTRVGSSPRPSSGPDEVTEAVADGRRRDARAGLQRARGDRPVSDAPPEVGLVSAELLEEFPALSLRYVDRRARLGPLDARAEGALAGALQSLLRAAGDQPAKPADPMGLSRLLSATSAWTPTSSGPRSRSLRSQRMKAGGFVSQNTPRRRAYRRRDRVRRRRPGV